MPQALVPALVIPLVGYRLYRRFRSHVGPQPVRRTRLVIRIGIFALLGAGFLSLAAMSAAHFAVATGGLVLGGAVGLAGLRLTEFDSGGREYTPDVRIGAAVSALLVARLVYRFAVLAPDVQAATTARGGSPADVLATLNQTPLTTALLMLVVGYYVVYSAGVLREARRRTTG